MPGEPLDQRQAIGQCHSAKLWPSIGQPQQTTLYEANDRGKRRFTYGHATFAGTALFLLMYSGPPRFRIRDGEASLRGDMDWVVVLHILVWGLAGAWVLLQILKRGRAKFFFARLRMPQKLGLAMILLLAVSAVASKAPALSAFKIYQMAVCLLFTHLFVQRFGYASCLKTIFWGTALLCGVTAVCAFLAPDLVWIASDFNPDPSRLMGLLAPTGVVSAFAIILLLTGVRRIWRVLPLALLSLFLALLVFSLTRTAYVVVVGFFVAVLVRRPNAKSLNRLAYVAGAVALALYAYHSLPNLSEYRMPETISSLDDRIGLWRYLSNVTLTQSPWWGLGYYSSSRVYGPQYNPGLGTAHSMFFEILLGGGVLSFALFAALCTLLTVHAGYLLFKSRDRFRFAVATLFFASLLFGSMGDEIDSGPVAMCFWYSAAVLPWMYQRSSKAATRSDESCRRLPVKAVALNEG
jgi:O-antigen ligase